MPNINIDDAYILGETGAQVDKVTGLFTKDEDTTSGEKAFAQLNIGTAGSNRNLLDNPWWGSGEVVNQRSVTTWTGNDHAYLIDRWDFTANSGENMTVTVWTSGLNITTAGSVGYAIEKLDAWQRSAINGKTITLSVMFADGTVKSGTGVFNLGTILYAYSDKDINLRLYSPNTSRAEFTIDIKANKNLLIRAVKLELGSVSTLANDAPPDYGEELAKCGRYFFRAKGEPIAVGYVSSNFKYVYVSVPALAPMRATPTISYSGGFTARLQEASIAITSMYASTPLTTGNAIGVQMVLASSARATGPAAIYCGANDYIDFSADL